MTYYIGQKNEYPENKKTYGTAFYVKDKSLIIKLPKHNKSCYAIDVGRLNTFLLCRWALQLKS